MDFGNEFVNWIIGLGAFAGALLAFSGVARLLSQMIIRINKQIEVTDSMQSSVKEQTKTMNEVVRQLMDENRRRAGNEERLKQTEQDLRKLRINTERRTDELTKSFKSIEEDIREIKDSLLKGDE